MEKLDEINEQKENKFKRKLQCSNDKSAKSKRLKVDSSLKNRNNEDSKIAPQWKESELISEEFKLDLNVTNNIINLFEDGNTIPFISRYRRHLTNNMVSDELRSIKEYYEGINTVKDKMTQVIKTLTKANQLTSEVKNALTEARSLEEIDYIYTPYKKGGKGTLADRAKKLGLEEVALKILHTNCVINLDNFVSDTIEELSSVSSVEKGIIHIISNIFATDSHVLKELNELKLKTNFTIKTKRNNRKKDVDPNEVKKYINYFEFEIPRKFIKPHQVLAINRGETLKVLSCSVVIPTTLYHNYKLICSKKWLQSIDSGNLVRKLILNNAIEDSYNRLVEPSIRRKIRAELKQEAERASCKVFATNLKQLLLGKPTKGKVILGIDPGFKNGCKVAVISPIGDVIASDVIYPHSFKNNGDASVKLKQLITMSKCDIIALGNGSACRETEEWLSNLIEKRYFFPMDVRYTIVREEGASIYSCSTEAKSEFSSLDPNIISAISLARRVQEPLAEFIKVEPKHLGIGMYQHDIKEKNLETALNGVISECVSFVGVDLNTASVCLLKHVSGLSEKKSQQIIKYRNENGAFMSRSQLLKVSGIGQKVFQQCVGFLRVGPINENDDSFYENSKVTKLDCTNIHPESYDIAEKLMKKFHLKKTELGSDAFILVIKNKSSNINLLDLSQELNSNQHIVELILEALSRPLKYDLRDDCSKTPLFKKGLNSINDLAIGTVLTGAVNNVTHFGCFVDIGVGSNGLIHTSKFNGLSLEMGTKVEVKILNIDLEKKRIQLMALKILE